MFVIIKWPNSYDKADSRLLTKLRLSISGHRYLTAVAVFKQNLTVFNRNENIIALHHSYLYLEMLT